MKIIPKPQVGEYDPYTIAYIDLVPDDGLILKYLHSAIDSSRDFYRTIPEEKLAVPHQVGEWTIKEILLHIIDSERVFAYRAFRAARNDKTPLSGFEQDDYVPNSVANERSFESILREYSAVRLASIMLFEYLPDEAWERQVIANGHPVSVRALAYQIAGHELHHIHSIKQDYLK